MSTAPPIAYRHQRAECRSRHDAAQLPRQHLQDGTGQEVAGQHGDDTHQRHVRAERGQTAVGEQQTLDEQHGRHHQYGGPRADQGGGQRTTEQVPARPRADREIHHLHREHERRGQAGQRRPGLADLPVRPLQAEPDRSGRDQTGGDGRRCVEEAIRNMHAHILDLPATRSQQRLTMTSARPRSPGGKSGRRK
jgi:hypothetical protein